MEGKSPAIDKNNSQKFADLEDIIKENFKEMRKRIKEKEEGFDLDMVDDKGKTALIHVVEGRNNTEQMWVLLDYGAEPNIQDEEGKTALHYAFAVERKDMIVCLLLFGADPEILDKEGKKPSDDFRDDVKPLEEAVALVKREFISLTRKRRKFLKYIFDEIDGEFASKQISINTLSSFYEKLNKESIESATKDAQIFISRSRLIKSGSDESPSITFEEFIVSICKIIKNHGMKVIDDFINRYKKIRKKEKPKAPEENAEGEGENKE